MVFDPNLPENDSDIDAAEMRTQLIGLRDGQIVTPRNYANHAAGAYSLYGTTVSIPSTLCPLSWTWYASTLRIYVDRSGVITFGVGYAYQPEGYWSAGCAVQIFKNGVAVAGTNHALGWTSGVWYHDLAVVEGDYFQPKLYLKRDSQAPYFSASLAIYIWPDNRLLRPYTR